MSYTIPSAAHAIGDPGHTTDHNNIIDVLSGMNAANSVHNTAYAGGARGDGTTNDAPAIQAALNACPAGGIVWLRALVYRTSSEITVPPFVTLAGLHGNRTDNTGLSATIKPFAAFTGTGCLRFKDKEEGGYSVDNNGIRIVNLVLDGSATTGSIEGIKATGLVHAVVLDRVAIQQFSSYGVGCHTYTRLDASVQHPYSWNLWNCMAWQNHDHGFFFGNQQTDCTFLNCEALGNVGDGFYLLAAQNSQCVACRSEFNLNGFNLQGSWGTTTASGGMMISGCTTDRNTQHGVRIESTGNGVHTIGISCRRDGRNTNAGGGGFAGIKVDGATTPVVITGLSNYPGVDDDGSGVSSPDYGLSVVNSSTFVHASNGFLHAAVAGVNWDGTGTFVTRGITTRTGSTSSPSTPDAQGDQGDAGNVFGTGADGALVFDGAATVAGLAPAANVYTMTRDLHATGVTVNNGVTLKTANYRVFVTGQLSNAGTISNLGNNASGSTAGGSGGSAVYSGGRAGGAGGTGVSGTGGAGTGASMGASAGAGGAGTSGAAGAAGAVASGVTAAIAQNNFLQQPYPILAGATAFNNAAVLFGWGAGGGGGGSDASSNAGGGGGGGGGIVPLFAWYITNTGTITASGGNGGNAGAGNAGGGGGGAGGLVAAYTLVPWTQSGTAVAAGGTHGNKTGTGVNGGDGGAGLVLNVVVG